ncbi:MAG: metalloregulator ArsR/SmtB family transcription factor [Gordonibacter sp.]|nr:metalloregulator ArsR/SmtB family transcription factor [Gordonibacter sp.]
MNSQEHKDATLTLPNESISHDDGCKCGCASHVEADGLLECLPDEELLYDLADLFKVFGDTTRIKILYALMGQERCVADIAELIGATQSAVSHQLRTLKQARLVKFQRDGKNVIYSLSDDHVHTMLAQGMSHICE